MDKYQDMDTTLKTELSEIAIAMEIICALQLALWQAVCHGDMEGAEYDMGFLRVWEMIEEVKDRLGELAS